MNEREKLLRRIQEEDFAVYETVLYLDGHPKNKKALAFYQKHRDMAAARRAEFEQKYGVLSIYGNHDTGNLNCINRPWPLEKEVN